jgi:hypothetical protein
MYFICRIETWKSGFYSSNSSEKANELGLSTHWRRLGRDFGRCVAERNGAFGAVEAISDPICITSGQKLQITISAEDLLTCCGVT